MTRLWLIMIRNNISYDTVMFRIMAMCLWHFYAWVYHIYDLPETPHGCTAHDMVMAGYVSSMSWSYVSLHLFIDLVTTCW